MPIEGQSRLETPHIWTAADEADLLREVTWGDLFRSLERTKIRGLIYLLLTFLCLAGTAVLILNYRQVVLGVVALVFAGYYYRCYVGWFGMYRNIYGRRRVIIPKLKIKRESLSPELTSQ